MDWSAFGIAFGALAVGCILRALLPYITSGLTTISEEGWSAWPKFEAKYVATFGLAIIGYGVVCLTVPGAVDALSAMTPVAAISLGYGGGDIIREGVKLVFSKLR